MGATDPPDAPLSLDPSRPRVASLAHLHRFPLSQGQGLPASADALPAWGFRIAAALLLIGWLAPNHYRPWASFYNELLAALGGAALVSAVLWRSAAVRVPPIAVVLVALAGVPLLQWLNGQIDYVGDAWIAALYLWGIALCIATGTNCADGPGLSRSRLLVWSLLWSGIASVGLGLYQWLGLSGLEIWAVDMAAAGRVVANLGQPNHLATLLSFAVFAAAYLHAVRLIGSGVAIGAVALLLLGSSLTQSRTPWLAFAVCAVLTWSAGRVVRQRLRIRRAVVLGLGAWFALCSIVTPHLARALDLVATLAPDGRLSAGLRPLLWSQMLEAIRLSPWTGYGWLQGHVAQGAAALQRPGLEYSSYAHNLFLDLLLWNGLPLGSLLIGAALLWFWSIARRIDDVDQWFRLMVVACFGAHAMVEFPHAYAYFLVPVAFFAGQLEASKRPGGGLLIPWAAVVAAAIATLALGAAVAVDYLRIEEDGRGLRMQLARIGVGTALPPVPPVRVLDQLQAMARTARVDPAPAMRPDEIADLLRVADRFPSLFFLPRAVTALALNDRQADAREQLRKLRGIHGEEQYAIVLLQMQSLAETTYPQLLGFVSALPAAVGVVPMPSSQRPTLPASR